MFAANDKKINIQINTAFCGICQRMVLWFDKGVYKIIVFVVRHANDVSTRTNVYTCHKYMTITLSML